MRQIVIATLLAGIAVNLASIARGQEVDPAWALGRVYGAPPPSDLDRCLMMGYRGREVVRCIQSLQQVREARRPPAYIPPLGMCDTTFMDGYAAFTDCW